MISNTHHEQTPENPKPPMNLPELHKTISNALKEMRENEDPDTLKRIPLENILEEHRDEIRGALREGYSWVKIAGKISKKTKRKISPSTLKRIIGSREKNPSKPSHKRTPKTPTEAAHDPEINSSVK
jgi:hypothetical protein